MNYVKVTHRDSCKTFALKRIGLSHLIKFENDSPTIKEIWNSDKFKEIPQPEIGSLLIWKHSNGEEGYWSPHEITKSGKIVFVKRFDYAHIGVYEEENMVSDLSWEEGWGTMIRLRNYNELPKPHLILKLTSNERISRL